MPVTILPSENIARSIRYVETADKPKEVLRLCYPGRVLTNLDLIQSSLRDNFPPALVPNRNGFYAAARAAYSSHHHLIIRPDDIWNAIIMQLNFYINKHAEELRGSFVAHQGKMELKIGYDTFGPGDVDFGHFAQAMSHLIQENVLDPELREWILPAFSTTTLHDKIVASVLLMSSMQKFFDYTCYFTCGLPSVTLLGTKADYELIDSRLDKLCTLGEETTHFRDLLRPVIRRMAQSFEQPESDETKDFWARIFKHERSGSGPGKHSGWITAFCYWDDDGNCLFRGATAGPEGVSSVDGQLCMDGVMYHKVRENKIPAGLCRVPVKIGDGEEIKTEMVAGSLGYCCTSSGEKCEDGSVGLDTMQPHTGWFIYEKADMMST